VSLVIREQSGSILTSVRNLKGYNWASFWRWREWREVMLTEPASF
jgi:hypothetical protein